MYKLFWRLIIVPLAIGETTWTPTPKDHSMYRDAVRNIMSSLAQTARNIANEDILNEYISNPVTIGGIISTAGPLSRMLFTGITGLDPAMAGVTSNVGGTTGLVSLGSGLLSLTPVLGSTLTLTPILPTLSLTPLSQTATLTPLSQTVTLTPAMPTLRGLVRLIAGGSDFTYFVDGYGNLSIEEIQRLVNQGVLDQSVLDDALTAASTQTSGTLVGSVIGVNIANTSPAAIQQLIPSIRIRPPRSISNTYIPTSGAPYQPSLGLEGFSDFRRLTPSPFHPRIRSVMI